MSVALKYNDHWGEYMDGGLARAAVRFMKGAVRAALGSGPALLAVRAAGPRRAAVFLLHRFANPALGVDGHPLSGLRSTLATLRRRRVTLMSLRELVRRIEGRERLPGPTAVFTVDDGYRDFATVAAPAFAEFDCPVTVFLISGFVDGRMWCWWNRVEAAFLASPRPEVAIECGGCVHRYPLTDAPSRQRAAELFVEVLKEIPDGERRRVVDAVGLLADVELPALPPRTHAAMTWDEVRRLEGPGVEFGPHTRTHPILAQVDDAIARDEVAGSWADLRRECRDPVPVFCYPNGTFDSYGEREMRLVQEGGMTAAMAVYDGYVTPPNLSGSARYGLPRFAFPHDATMAAYQASGLARLPPRPPARRS